MTLEQDGRGFFAALLQHQPLVELDFGRGVTLPSFEVDRDPDCFRHVLAWMRSHRLPSAIASDKATLEDLEMEASFFALDDLTIAIQEALVPLRCAAEPLRPFSVTAGTVMYVSHGGEVKQAAVLQPHELCFVSYATCATLQFSLPRKYHKVYCDFEERDAGSDDKWEPLVPKPANFRDTGVVADNNETRKALLASFVYKHHKVNEHNMEAEFCADDLDQSTDVVCAPQFAQRLHVLLGPRGVHNPESTAAAASSGAKKETRLCFQNDDFDMENGATWSIYGVIGPAEKVLEYSRGS